MSWRHLMPKHETQNTFYWITWEVKTASKWNLVSLCNIPKGNFLSENSLKNLAWKLVPGLFRFSRIPLKKWIWGGQSAGLDKFWKFGEYISNVSCLLQKFHFPIEVVLNSLQVAVLVEFFNKIFSFVIWHKLAKYHYEAVFTSQVIQ